MIFLHTLLGVSWAWDSQHLYHSDFRSAAKGVTPIPAAMHTLTG